ncbi:MAG: MerR family transcriptional regulator [Acidobacteria bacterium]|nr:MerR family transcriptional regulator [Acidobacteriota bacterium]MBV9146877.1 MerR family transcriptional regulator [Acidobacteriota bacterium]MBV9436532.1 MerR family transcriptional regulator [Acidobacteriota bacterium]
MPLVGAKRAAAVRAKQKPADEIVVPDKLFFRIGEVSNLCSLPAYVLRFWETEFPQLKPSKSNTGQRVYRRKDVENILRVKKLLYEQGYTISGARQLLKTEGRRDRGQSALPFIAPAANHSELRDLKQGLKEVLGILSAKR